MLISRRCVYAKADGQPCRMAPLHDRPYCFSHDPERAEEAAEARRIGGLRRKKEGTIAVAYDLPGLDTVVGIRRLLEIVVTDGIGLENGVARRLDRVEAGLSPTELVVQWLTEAHAFDDFPAYTRSLVAVEPPVFPLDRLAQAAKANATSQARGLPREEAVSAINGSIVATVFRFKLVLRIISLAQEFL